MKLARLTIPIVLALLLSVISAYAQTVSLPLGVYLPVVIDARESVQPQPTTPAPLPTDALAMRREVIKLVNDYRVANGCPATFENSVLMDAAQAWSDYMREQSIFEHSSNRFPDWYVSRGYQWDARENLGSGQETPQKIVNDWKNSPNHNRTLLSCRYASQGATYDLGVGLNGRLWTLALGERLP